MAALRKLQVQKLAQRVLPGGHGRKRGEAQTHLLQAGVLRARRGARERLRRAWLNPLVPARKAEDLARELRPARLSFARHVKRAAEARALEKFAQRARDGDRARRIAPLVVDDLERRARAVRQLQHRVDEARPAKAIEPADAADAVVRAQPPNQLLARELGLPVDRPPAVCRVELRIGPRRIPREHIVGRDRDEAHPLAVARRRHIGRAARIEPVGAFGRRLAGVNRRCGRAVDHRVGPRGGKHGVNGVLVRDVRLGKIRGDDPEDAPVPRRLALQDARDRPPQHAPSACQQDGHRTASPDAFARSLRYSP